MNPRCFCDINPHVSHGASRGGSRRLTPHRLSPAKEIVAWSSGVEVCGPSCEKTQISTTGSVFGFRSASLKKNHRPQHPEAPPNSSQIVTPAYQKAKGRDESAGTDSSCDACATRGDFSCGIRGAPNQSQATLQSG